MYESVSTLNNFDLKPVASRGSFLVESRRLLHPLYSSQAGFLIRVRTWDLCLDQLLKITTR